MNKENIDEQVHNETSDCKATLPNCVIDSMRRGIGWCSDVSHRTSERGGALSHAATRAPKQSGTSGGQGVPRGAPRRHPKIRLPAPPPLRRPPNPHAASPPVS